MAGEGSGEMFEAVKRAISHKTQEGRRQRAAPTPRLLDAFERTFLPTDKVISARR
jgi:hypothetical protein